MRLVSALLISLIAISVSGYPLERGHSHFLESVDDILLFDAPAFPDPVNQVDIIVAFQAFVYHRDINHYSMFPRVETALKSIGIGIGANLARVNDRLRLFSAKGLSGKVVTIDVIGCNKQVQLHGTSRPPNLGMVWQRVSVGVCGGVKQLRPKVLASRQNLDTTKSRETAFFSPNSGYGVISDIDDTVKISHVLDKVALARSTLLDTPIPVPDMPELYAYLAVSLNSPQFLYVSGSPFQLYPFLHDFITNSYPKSKGPILLQNLTLSQPEQVIDIVMNNGIKSHKLTTIARIHEMYPMKHFLAIGDSGQEDPEIYGEAYRNKEYRSGFIMCIWIRQIKGANNNGKRFANAFKGVPQDKVKIFTDGEIPSLQKIDVAGGKCQ